MLSVYCKSHVCGDVCKRCCFVLESESAKPLGMIRIEIMLDDHRLVMGIIAGCVQTPQTPFLIPAPSLWEQHPRYVPHQHFNLSYQS
jgi:hypothetical protein